MKKITKAHLFRILQDYAIEENSRWDNPDDVECYNIEVELSSKTIQVRPQVGNVFHSVSEYISVAESLGFSTYLSIDKNSSGIDSPTLNII